MKVWGVRQLSKNKGLTIILCLLTVSYIAAYSFIKKINNVVFQQTVIFENADQIQTILASVLKKNDNNSEKNLSVIYFWQAYCPCNLGVNPHYADLFAQYNKAGVDFFVVDFSSEISTSAAVPQGALLDKNTANKLRPYVRYAPSIAVLNANKELLYYGPHSLGFVCNAQTSIVSKVIATFQQGVFSKNTNVIAEACFCRLNTGPAKLASSEF